MASIDRIEVDSHKVEEVRRALVDFYSRKINQHVLLMVSIFIGSTTVFAKYPEPISVFTDYTFIYISIVFFVLFAYLFGRSIYWDILLSITLPYDFKTIFETKITKNELKPHVHKDDIYFYFYDLVNHEYQRRSSRYMTLSTFHERPKLCYSRLCISLRFIPALILSLVFVFGLGPLMDGNRPEAFLVRVLIILLVNKIS